MDSLVATSGHEREGVAPATPRVPLAKVRDTTKRDGNQPIQPHAGNGSNLRRMRSRAAEREERGLSGYGSSTLN